MNDPTIYIVRETLLLIRLSYEVKRWKRMERYLSHRRLYKPSTAIG